MDGDEGQLNCNKKMDNCKVDIYVRNAIIKKYIWFHLGGVIYCFICREIWHFIDEIAGQMGVFFFFFFLFFFQMKNNVIIIHKLAAFVNISEMLASDAVPIPVTICQQLLI